MATQTKASLRPKTTWREQYKNFRSTHAKFQDFDNHVRQNKEVYLFGAGLVIGVFAARLFVRPSVVVNNIVNQGTA